MICADCARAAAIIEVYAWQPGYDEQLDFAMGLHDACQLAHEEWHHGVFYASGCNCQHEWRRHIERVRAAHRRAA